MLKSIYCIIKGIIAIFVSSSRLEDIMKLKRIVAGMMGAAMMLSLAACGGNNTNNTTATSGNSTTAATTSANSTEGTTASEGNASEETYHIGICQLVQHVALDEATRGFQEALKEKLGDRVSFDMQNAQGESVNCSTIVNQFVSAKVDLILANATAPLQAAAAATAEIPILGTSITDYATALDIDNWSGQTGRNISGTADLAPLDEQAAVIQELFPDAKEIGLLYCSGEPNSQYQVDIIKGHLEGMGYTCTYYSFVDSNDIASVVTNAASNSDVIYIPTDNTAASNTEVIQNVCLPAQVPVVTGEEGICKGCGVVTLSISYYDIGYISGEMAYEILVNGADITTMDINYAPNVVKKYNVANCEALGITVPEGYEPIEVEE